MLFLAAGRFAENPFSEKALAEVHEAAQATGDAEGVSAEDEKLEDAFKAMELAFKEEMGIVDEGEAPAEAAEA